jgi:hypothetical protein
VSWTPTATPPDQVARIRDYGHQHVKQPKSLRMQVDLLNAVVSAARRPVNLSSLTVPATLAPDVGGPRAIDGSIQRSRWSGLAAVRPTGGG